MSGVAVALPPVPQADEREAREVRARRRSRREARQGVWMAGAFAGLMAAARVIDVSEDGKLMLLVALLFAAGAGLTAVARPRLLPLLIAGYLPFSRVYALAVPGIPGANATNLLLLFAVVAAAALRSRSGRPLRWGVLEWLILAYVGVGALSLPQTYSQTGEPGETVYLFRAWVAPILFFFAARALVRDREDIEAVLMVMAWTTALVGVATVFDGIDRGTRGSIEASRVPGLMRQANSMGAFLVYYGVPLLAMGLRVRLLPLRAALFAAYAICARAMLYTFSRGAYLAMAAGSALVLTLHSPLLLVGASVGGVAAMTAMPELIPDSVRARLGETAESGGTYESGAPQLDRSSAHRLILWRGAVRMIQANPLGVGLGQFRPLIRYYTEIPLRPHDPDDAHNAYLLTAAEQGVLALVLMLAIVLGSALLALRLYLGRRSERDRTLTLAFVGTVVGVLVSCMLGSRFSDEALIGYFWVLVALVAVVRRLRDEPRPARRPAS